jgi:Transposase DDE domain group 1
MLASRERRETSVALTSTLHWFETDVLTEERNYRGLAHLNTALIQHPATRLANRRVTLDIDSSESPVHGSQEESAYNGHFESVCYHPLFVFNPKFKTGGRLIRHARYFTLRLAESHLTRPLFRQIVARIERLGWHPT